MEKVNWKIDGMTCANCALTVHKYLEKQGVQDVRVSLASNEVSFDTADGFDASKIRKGMKDLGYTVMQEGTAEAGKKKKWNKHLVYLLVCLPWTLILMLPHILGLLGMGHSMVLMQPWVQFFLCLPVFVVGMSFFGRSALKSLLNGLPNMNVLIAAGSAAAWIYSVVGTLMGWGPDFLFYETAASIITIVFGGYYLEDLSINATQRALNDLVKTQKTMANMIAFDDQHQEMIFPVEAAQLHSGDLVLIRAGEEVPADCKILWGEAGVNEAIVTGESLPVDKKAKDHLIGGSVLVSGSVRAQVSAAAGDSVLAGIVRLVKQAQGEKPPIQKLADKISAIFVPVVLSLALLTLLANWWYLHTFTQSLMRMIAVLLIACPCAMGLATPAAIAVGLGRAARRGILFRKAEGLEAFKDIRQVVFDKTGTLTTGEFTISEWKLAEDASISEAEFKSIAFALEKYSVHPIARAIVRDWKPQKTAVLAGASDAGTAPVKTEIRWGRIEEVKGLGMRAETRDGDIYWIGSKKAVPGDQANGDHNVYIVKNDRLLGWIDVVDQVRPEAAEVIGWLKSRGLHTVMLSGDRAAACQRLASQLGIQEVLAEQSPSQKLEQIVRLNALAPTAMVGDGINDAPALAKATIGISMSDASQLAMQTADVVLMNQGLKQLPAALGLGRHTYGTIKGNLFWAFFYNIIAIPVAAVGLLTPTVAAIVMGLSDVVLAINSVRLFVRKVV